MSALATIYRAVREPLGRTVVIKALSPAIAPSSSLAAQVEREATILALLSHPNVIALHDYVKTSAQLYLVLEHIDGFSLADVTARKVRLEPEVVAALGAYVAEGLAHAHDRGVVHRDVKPANVLVSREGGVKLIDFGIAQVEGHTTSASDAEPHEGPAFGTPAYMSPEQILSEQVDLRSDLFSLGVVLYQLLAGSRPFDREDERARSAAQRIRRAPPHPLRKRVPGVPRALERVIMRLLEKNPDDRHDSARVVAELLRDVVRAETEESLTKLTRRALIDAGLVRIDGDVARPQRRERPAGVRAIGSSLYGFLGIGAVLVAGGAIIQLTAARTQQAAPPGEHPLELAPSQAGGLRVLASPWAELWVDGQHVETTPFAKAIPLPAGTHFVTLTHPAAAAVKRTITVRAGETLMLDVHMPLTVDAGASAQRAGE